MNRTDRRKQLALLLCCGFAGTLVGGYAGEASAQGAAPLRVDPVLLGLPPIQAEQAPAAKTPAPAEKKEPVETRATGPAEVKPVVEPTAVESKPVSPRPQEQVAAPAREPASEATPRPTPPVAPASVAKEAERRDTPTAAPFAPAATAAQPAASSSAPAARETAKPAAPAVAKVPAPVPAASNVTSLEPLRVDPALLGLPPIVPPSQLAGQPGVPLPGGVRPPVLAPTGPREEEEVLDSGPALALRASPKMETLPKDSAEPRPVFLSAQRMDGEVNREFRAEGDAELRKIGSVVNADRMTYWPLDDEVEAVGNVRLQQGEDHVAGPKMRLRLEDQVGYFEQPTYYLKHQSLLAGKAEADRAESSQILGKINNNAAWSSGFEMPRSMSIAPGQTRLSDKLKLSQTTESRGEADRIDFEGENHFRLWNNTFTTCPIDNNDWYVRTKELKLDYDREVGEGKDATVYFKDVPILYTPWLSFSLNNERKSGFLRPSIGTNSDNGFEYEQPYYWNIAPNMDATITPRLMSKRGLQIGNQFRYLNTAFGGAYSGRVEAEILPGDRLRDGDNRYGVSLLHNQVTSTGFTGLINYNKVSDDDYYTDLSSDITRTSQTQLLQQGVLSYSGGGWWSASINFQQYQTLQPDKDNPVLEQYRMLPQITVNARKPDFHGADVGLMGQLTNFTISERQQFGTIYPDGKRTVLYPHVSLPYVRPGWYVTPKLGVNYRGYTLNGQASGTPGSMSVTLPIFSVDSGMTFERSSNWFGRDYTQTLEPRLYYLNIPYKDQSAIPLFDTGLADFNFAQIFSENQFSGWDRVNNANQLTAALTSRLIEPATGNEIMRAMIGQRFYFTRNKVALSGAATTSDTDKWDRSDMLAAFNGQILPKVYVDTAVQFDLNDRRTERYSVGLRYQPEPGKVLNTSYRYNRDAAAPINQVDISGQWPITGRWHGVGRLNYSLKDDGTVLSTGGQGGRMIESIAGLEYDGGCWIIRGVVRRQALTSADASTSFFVQLELSGLGRIGSNPLGLLKRNIQGYSLISDPAAESVFDD